MQPAKLNVVKSECKRSHLVARISLNFLQQFHSGCTIIFVMSLEDGPLPSLDPPFNHCLYKLYKGQCANADCSSLPRFQQSIAKVDLS